MEIKTSYHWEMGHRLPGHPGGCRNLHGHSYRLDVEIQGEVDESGMLIDFFDVDKAVAPIIEDLDHAFLCDEGDRDLEAFIKSQGWKLAVLPYPSTAENLCRFFAGKLEPALGAIPRICSFAVTIQETRDASARLEVELHRPRED
ncbi:MAG: 6-pyruvoyl trahydropterin synthase family protein [Planctomycetota bacterium]|jgi:6-pyruvoyltetrahydropterin/6-carboxytetrahydropterin synthase